MKATGDRVLGSDFSQQNYDESLFYECSTSATRCIEVLGAVPIPPEFSGRKNASTLHNDTTQWPCRDKDKEQLEMKVRYFR